VKKQAVKKKAPAPKKPAFPEPNEDIEIPPTDEMKDGESMEPIFNMS